MLDAKKREVEEWYTLYSESIFKYIFMMTHDYQQSEDLTQETFVKVFVHYDSFHRNSSPKTWIYRIAHNVTVDAQRKKKPLLKVKEFFQSADPKPLPDEVVTIRESSVELFQLLQKLKPNYREVIVFRKVKGLSTKETAEILQWSESKVKMTLNRALTALEKEMEKEGYKYEKFI